MMKRVVSGSGDVITYPHNHATHSHVKFSCVPNASVHCVRVTRQRLRGYERRSTVFHPQRLARVLVSMALVEKADGVQSVATARI